MDGWMCWVGEWMCGWEDGWMSGWVGVWISEWADGWVNEWMDGWLNGWTSKYLDGWIDLAYWNIYVFMYAGVYNCICVFCNHGWVSVNAYTDVLYVRQSCPRRAKLSVWSPLAMRYVQHSWSGCKYTSSFSTPEAPLVGICVAPFVELTKVVNDDLTFDSIMNIQMASNWRSINSKLLFAVMLAIATSSRWRATT